MSGGEQYAISPSVLRVIQRAVGTGDHGIARLGDLMTCDAYAQRSTKATTVVQDENVTVNP